LALVSVVAPLPNNSPLSRFMLSFASCTTNTSQKYIPISRSSTRRSSKAKSLALIRSINASPSSRVNSICSGSFINADNNALDLGTPPAALP
jgi:hypothetical protein